MGNKTNCCAGDKPKSDKDQKFPRIEDKKSILAKPQSDTSRSSNFSKQTEKNQEQLPASPKMKKVRPSITRVTPAASIEDFEKTIYGVMSPKIKQQGGSKLIRTSTNQQIKVDQNDQEAEEDLKPIQSKEPPADYTKQLSDLPTTKESQGTHSLNQSWDDQEQIKQPYADKNKLKFGRLPNKLKYLLVRDENAKQASACCFVKSGSLNDPKDFQGLAHFCEHMLFLGTKNRDENAYTQYLTQHGGSRNAGTAEDMTFFFFDVTNDALQGALELFSEFFKCPTFSESGVEREINSIESEFRKNQSSEIRRINQIEKSHLTSKDSALNGFQAGNLKSLTFESEEKQAALRQALKTYYETEYSSNIMNLVVVGNYGLEELEEMVQKHFEDIENKNAKLKDFSDDPNFKQTYGKIVQYVPNKATKLFTLKWEGLPCNIKDGPGNPLLYIGHVLGHEGKGSLMSCLIKKNYATNLMSGPSFRMQKTFSGFYLDITLTDKGMAEWEEVVRLVFAHINNLRREKPQKFYLEELKWKKRIQFYFQTPKSAKTLAVEYCQRLSESEDKDKVSDMLIKPFLATQVTLDEISGFLDRLTPQNCFIIHRSTEFASLEDLETEVWYDSKFRVVPIADNLLREWSEAQPSPEDNLHHPPPNQFAPIKHPNILLAPKQSKPSKPVKIHDSEKSLVYFKQDDTFDQPFVWSRVEILCRDIDVIRDECGKAFIIMWIEMFKEQIRELRYMADEAGVKLDINWNSESLVITVYGYNESYERYYEQIFCEMKQIKAEKQFFEAKKDQILLTTHNIIKSEPAQRYKKMFTDIMIDGTLTIQTQQAMIESFDFEKFELYTSRWMKNMKMTWLITGHLVQEDALKMVINAENALDYNPIDESTYGFVQSIHLKENAIYHVDQENELEKSKNNGICVVFDLGREVDDPQEQAVNHIAASLIHEPCFQQLRTVEQLGYTIRVSKETNADSSTIQIFVQSSKFDAHYLEHRINEFLSSYVSKGEDGSYKTSFTEKSVQINIDNIVKSLQQDQPNLQAESQFNWAQLTEKRLDFDKREQQIEYLHNVKLEHVHERYQDIFLRKPRRLNIRMHSKDPKFKDEEKLQENRQLNEKFYAEMKERYGVECESIQIGLEQEELKQFKEVSEKLIRSRQKYNQKRQQDD